MFSSPLRPAAAPFRTSPATPQPVAFSSTSSLPTSSPPHFSNGSVELQHEVSDATEQSVPDAESPYVLFSAHKVRVSLPIECSTIRHDLSRSFVVSFSRTCVQLKNYQYVLWLIC